MLKKAGRRFLMKNKFFVMEGGVLLTVLAACNLLFPGKPTAISFPTVPIFPATNTLTVPAHGQPSLTPNPFTPTLTPTATVTVNPLGIPPMAIGTSIDLTQIDMLDAQNGWGIGGSHMSGTFGHIFRTMDGGTSWFEVTPPAVATSVDEAASLGAVGFFSTTDTAWVTYDFPHAYRVPVNPVVWKTTDGGRTWQASSPLATADLMETYYVSEVFFATPSVGWVLAHVGAGMNHDYVALYRTSDGGSTWTRVIDPNNDGGIQGCEKTGLVFSDASNGWLTGNCNGVAPGALLFQTGDGGSSWNPIHLPAPIGHPDLFTAMQYACGVRAPFVRGTQIYLGVECMDMSTNPGTAIPYLYRGPVSGGNWSYLAYPGGDIITLDGNRIWALGKNIYRSEDGGYNWPQISTVTWDGQFDFVSSTQGFAIAMKEGGYSLVQTNDGGALWSLLSPVVIAWPGT
jgi:photosystem II stability/assembly factor-like uncharacterized protein